MAAEATVSILVNCYNSEAYLRQAIDSIYAQTYQRFEVILVDNCSTDKTAEIAHSYDKRLKYVKTDKTIPLYAARNVGLKFANGEYLAFLDSDDWWLEDKLEKQIDLINNKEADFVYSSYRSEIEVTGFFKRAIFLTYLRLLSFSYSRYSSEYVNKVELIKKYNINLQTVMLKTALLKDMQFDDGLSLMGDLDFFFRLFWEKSAKIYYDTRVTAVSRVHSKQLSRNSSSDWVSETERVLRKNVKLFESEELRLFEWYFLRFYQSQVLLEQGHKREALLIKKDYLFSGLAYAMHFFKALFTS